MRMMTIKQCANFLNVSTTTIQRIIDNKQFCKTVKYGNKIRVSDKDFLSWVETNEDTIIEYSIIE